MTLTIVLLALALVGPKPATHKRGRPNSAKMEKLYRAITTLKVAIEDQNVKVFEFQRMATEAKVEAELAGEEAMSSADKEFVRYAAAAAKDAEDVGHSLGETKSDFAALEKIRLGLLRLQMISLRDDITAAVAVYHGQDPPPPNLEATKAAIDAMDVPKVTPAPPRPEPVNFSASPLAPARLTDDPRVVSGCTKAEHVETTGPEDQSGTYTPKGGPEIRFSNRNEVFALIGANHGGNVVLVTSREPDKIEGEAYLCEQPKP